MSQSLKVFIESMYSGMVPAVVDAVWIKEDGTITFDVTVTATRRNYTRGDKLPGLSPSFTLPRHAVRKFRSSPFPKVLAFDWYAILNISNRPSFYLSR